jgi:hypothetical protein
MVCGLVTNINARGTRQRMPRHRLGVGDVWVVLFHFLNLTQNTSQTRLEGNKKIRIFWGWHHEVTGVSGLFWRAYLTGRLNEKGQKLIKTLIFAKKFPKLGDKRDRGTQLRGVVVSEPLIHFFDPVSDIYSAGTPCINETIRDCRP